MSSPTCESSQPLHPFTKSSPSSLLSPKINRIQKLFPASRTAPSRALVILILFQAILSPIVTVHGQEYLSLCDYSDSKPSCLSNKFLVCLSNRCHCADEVNHIYDFAQDTCVIMTGRKCTDRIQIKLGSSHVIDLDPRQLESDKSKQFPDPAFPRCQDNAFCDMTSSTCKCKLGYFYNERSGQCELSLGKSCTPEDTILLNKTGGKGAPSSVLTQLPYSSSDNLRGCDANVGLRCGTEGVCKCEDHSVWQIDIGCVSLLGSTTTEKSKTVQVAVGSSDNEQNTGNDFLSQANNFTRTIYYNNGDDSGLTPFQKLVNSYTKVLIEANNRYYLTHDDTETGMNSPNIELADKIIFSQDPQQNSSRGNLQRNQTINFVGDRNQFPGGGQQGQTNPIWNLLLPQKNNGNRNSYNNTSGLAKLQEQAVQLQKLLIQQQQLTTLIDQLNDLTMITVPSQQPTVFPTSSLLITPAQNNYLGNGNNQNFEQYPQQQQQTPGFNRFWNNRPAQNNNNQQTIGGAFPLFRLFKNLVDPVKRSIFPNLANAVTSLPSPMHLVASTVNNFLPVLRTLDRQFSPMLQNFVELTRPKPRAHILPYYFNRGNNQYQTQNSFSSNSNNAQGLLQQLYQPNQGNPVFGNGNNYGPGTDLSVVNQRNGRMREDGDGNNDNVTRRSILGRRLWWL